MADTYRIAYDVERKRPGCVLIQAALGCTVPSKLFYDLFPTEVWETGNTDGMKVYQTTLEELERVSKITLENAR